MYKNLSPEEQRMIREGTDTSQPPIGRARLVRNLLIFAFAFALFVLLGFLIVSSGAGL